MTAGGLLWLPSVSSCLLLRLSSCVFVSFLPSWVSLVPCVSLSLSLSRWPFGVRRRPFLLLCLSVVSVVARRLFCACCRGVPWVTLYPLSLSPSSLVPLLRPFVSSVLVSRSSRSGLYPRRVVA